MGFYGAEDAIEALRAIVAGREDFVYQPHPGGCAYSIKGQPDCLVGHVLARWSLLYLVADQQTKPIRTVANVYQRLDRGAVEVLDAAQVQQDVAAPWGVALAVAEKKYEELES